MHAPGPANAAVIFGGKDAPLSKADPRLRSVPPSGRERNPDPNPNPDPDPNPSPDPNPNPKLRLTLTLA